MTNLQQILKLPETFWRKLAEAIQLWIREDMEKGYPQEYTSQLIPTKNGAKNYSDEYKILKANGMRRKTKGGTLKTFDPSGDYLGRRRYGKTTSVGKGIGAFVTGYKGGYPISNHTASVNMMLTGFTISGLKYKNSDDTSMTIGYLDKDGDKIEGNENWGRDIRTLNDKNKDKTLKLLEDEFLKNIKDWEKTRIVIKVNAK